MVDDDYQRELDDEECDLNSLMNTEETPMPYEHETEEWWDRHTPQEVNPHDCAEAELHEMLKRLVKLVDETYDNSEGNWPDAEPGCSRCTSGSTPYKYDTGLCAYHAAKRLLKQLEVRP